MYSLYQNVANSTTGGTAIGTAGQDIEVKTLLVGNPVANANIWFYDETNVGNVTNTTGLQAKLTLPSSFATGQLPFVIDLTDRDGHGLILKSGGSMAIDQTGQYTLGWDVASQPSNTV